MRSITYAYHDLVNEKTTARESGATMSEYHNDGDNHDHHCSKREQGIRRGALPLPFDAIPRISRAQLRSPISRVHQGC